MRKLLKKIPFAPVAAIVFGVVTAILVMATPLWLFERAVVSVGLPNMIAAAKPPLGDTARLFAAIVAALCVAITVWLPLAFISKAAKTKRPKARGMRIDPSLPLTEERHSSMHRRPIFAGQDLGAPFMSDEAMAIAKDELVLDLPEELAVQPSPPAPAPVAVAPPIETLEQRTPETPSPMIDQNSISSLMSRLEVAVERRQTRGQAVSPLPGTIGSLRAAMGLSSARAATGR
jgi:hypothetical protein